MFLIHTPPEHAEIVARAVVSACRLDGWHSPVQPKLLHTLFNRLLAQDLDFEKIEPLSPAEVAATLCTPAEREELNHLMVAIEKPLQSHPGTTGALRGSMGDDPSCA